MKRRTSALGLVFVLSVFGACDCGDADTPGDGGGMDGSAADGAATDGARPDGAGTDAPPRIDGDACLANGATCVAPADCCSTECTGGTCGPATACAAVGSHCADDDGCCSRNCVGSGGGDCGGAGDCVCAPRAACTASGAACTDDDECCNGLCDRPGGAADGTCASIGACMTAGEPCGTEGLSGSCCSTVCLDTEGEGMGRCQYLGGCRVQDELCRTSAECCSGVCEERGTTADGRPIMRCANAGSCLPAGEVCGEGGASSNCCPNGGGDTGCEPTGTGFRRCFGGTSGCTIPSHTCTTTEDCCVETFSHIMCQPDRTGEMVCCLSDGEECAFGDVCCSGICAPDPSDGVLRCGAMCVADGGACTTAADCCGCGCIAGASGRVCTSDPALCAPCTGPQLGELCEHGGEPCCNEPTVVCDPAAAEFPTCVLAR